jgi:hypothetical protein
MITLIDIVILGVILFSALDLSKKFKNHLKLPKMFFGIFSVVLGVFLIKDVQILKDVIYLLNETNESWFFNKLVSLSR